MIGASAKAETERITAMTATRDKNRIILKGIHPFRLIAAQETTDDTDSTAEAEESQTYDEKRGRNDRTTGCTDPSENASNDSSNVRKHTGKSFHVHKSSFITPQ